MKHRTTTIIAGLAFACLTNLHAEDVVNNGDFANSSTLGTELAEGGGPLGSFFSRFGVGAQVGTNGIGGHLTFDLTHWMYVKGEISGLSGGPSFDFETDEVEYEGELELFAAGVTLNILPFKALDVPLIGGFRITGGAYQVDHRVGVTSTDSLDPVLQGQLAGAGINPDGALTGEIEFSNFAPYIGIGWDWSIGAEDQIMISLDVGVLFVGSGEATLTQSADLAASGFVDVSDTADQEQQVQDELDKFEIYPVVQLGATYRF